MPVAYRVLLHIDEPDLVQARHLRALATSLLEPDDGAVQHHANAKPFTLTPLHRIGELLAIDIKLLVDGLEHTLLRAIEKRDAEGSLRLGRSPVSLAPAGVQVVDRISWDELHADVLDDEHIAVELLTPTVFRSGKHEQHPFPSPGVTFGHYRSRWNLFAPASLRCDLEFGPLVLQVDEFAGRSGVYVDGHRRNGRLTEVVFTGFVGHVRYRCGSPRVTDDQRRWLHRLASLAEFCGTGANTTIGMGVSRYLGPLSPQA